MLVCPYCLSENPVDPAYEGFFEQHKLYKHQCDNCSKNFIFETEISVSFHPRKADCLNDGKHKWKPIKTLFKKSPYMRCTQCGKYLDSSKEKMKTIIEK